MEHLSFVHIHLKMKNISLLITTPKLKYAILGAKVWLLKRTTICLNLIHKETLIWHIYACVQCPTGKYEPTPGSVSCEEVNTALCWCAAAIYSAVPMLMMTCTAAIQCPAGKANNQEGATALSACVDCTAGHWSSAASATCTPVSPNPCCLTFLWRLPLMQRAESRIWWRLTIMLLLQCGAGKFSTTVAATSEATCQDVWPLSMYEERQLQPWCAGLFI